MSDMEMKTRENDFDGNEYEGTMTERQVIDKLSPIFFPITDVDRFFRTTTLV